MLDRSRDGSLEVLRELAAASPARDGAAPVAPVRAPDVARRRHRPASGDAVIMMDCDLQHPPEVIPELLGRFEEGFEWCTRCASTISVSGSLKRFTSRLFYELQNRLSPVEIKEGAADFRLVSARVAAVFRESIREQNQFLRGLFQWVGFRTQRYRLSARREPPGRPSTGHSSYSRSRSRA